MQGEIITLAEKTWRIGPLIAEGSFGAVFEAVSRDGEEAAAKFVLDVPASARELSFDELSQSDHLLPVLATGSHKGALVIIMPRAEANLRTFLDSRQGALPLAEAIGVLRDIAAGLCELATAGVVHRDIKPENVLRYHGRWRIADFGVAKHTAAATATHTFKDAFPKAYAAPEQWDHRPVSDRTDVYAFGILAYEILTGTRPFASSEGDYAALRRAHCEQQVHLDGFSPPIVSLVGQCTMKQPESRPAAASIARRLKSLDDPRASLPGILDLAAAKAEEDSRIDAWQLQVDIERRESERFNRLMDDARELWIPLSDALNDAIAGSIDSDSGASRTGAGAWRLRVGSAEMEVTSTFGAQRTGPRLPFELVAGAFVSITFPRGTYRYKGRSHSLWYGDMQTEGDFGWYEVAFMSMPGTGHRDEEPFALRPDWSVGDAFAGKSKHYRVAWPVTEWRLDSLDEPVNRWAGWFAAAIRGELQRPSAVELPVEGTWRVGASNE